MHPRTWVQGVGSVYMADFVLSSPDLISHWAWEVNKDGIDALRPKPKRRPNGSARPTPLTEEDKLRRENELLKAELAYLKKITGLKGSTTRLKVEAIITFKSDHRLDDLITVSDLPSPGEGLIVHTDQGFQYQHASWRDLMTSIGGVQSMSRKGNCYDNKVMEIFFGHLKSEMYHGVSFSSVEEFCHAVDDYILWYNTTRLQEQFKGLAPMQYRNQALAKTQTTEN